VRRRNFLFAAGFLASPLGAMAFQGNDDFILADIVTPRLDGLGGPEAFAHEAISELQRYLAASNFIQTARLGTDRWGRSIVHAAVDGKDCAGLLVAGGFARVNPWSNDEAYIDTLLGAEIAARGRNAGLWGLPDYDVINANSGKPRQNVFNVLQGRVVRAAKFEGRVFLNFGEDFRTDITATIQSRSAKKWKIVPVEIEGRTVRVRGFTEWINGPSLQIYHPQSLEYVAEN
jgi:hypothetical protein